MLLREISQDENRAEGCGFTAEVKGKMAGKYNEVLVKTFSIQLDSKTKHYFSQTLEKAKQSTSNS